MYARRTLGREPRRPRLSHVDSDARATFTPVGVPRGKVVSCATRRQWYVGEHSASPRDTTPPRICTVKSGCRPLQCPVRGLDEEQRKFRGLGDQSGPKRLLLRSEISGSFGRSLRLDPPPSRWYLWSQVDQDLGHHSLGPPAQTQFTLLSKHSDRGLRGRDGPCRGVRLTPPVGFCHHFFLPRTPLSFSCLSSSASTVETHSGPPRPRHARVVVEGSSAHPRRDPGPTGRG